MRTGLTSVLAVSRAMSGPGAAPLRKQVRASRDRQASHPAHQDALRHAIRSEPAREDGLRDQHFEKPGQQKTEEQLEPHAPRELAGCEQTAHGQRRVLGKSDEQSDEQQPREDPGADVHASCHVSPADRGARYSKPPDGAPSASWRTASMSP
jgi:tRNA U34 5-methylaminomethyl-2-thiouridine-forming methyltransferase MnmC